MRLKISGLLAMLLIVVVFISGCSSTSKKNNNKIQVVSTLNFYGEVAKEVGGNHVSVKNIIDDPAVDPHDFEPTTKTAKEMVDANVVVSNGMGTDDWVNKITPDKKGLASIKVGKILHKKDGENPHLWYEIDTMETLANQLAQQFSKQDAKHAKMYQANAKKYIESLAPIKQQMNQIKKQANGQKVAVTEPVYNYTLKELGYQIINAKFALSIENETDPSPKMVEALQADLNKKRVAFVVNNQQTSSKITEQMLKLAKKNHIAIVNVTETMPENQNYQEWIKAQLNQISKIQKEGN